MSNKKDITIEKREFKIKNGEKFILEYPSNFEEIANKKLSQLQQDYDKSISNNINNIQSININSDNNYYQQIGETENINIEKNKEMKLEPQEGFIEIKPKNNSNINDNKNDNKDKNDKNENDDDEVNSDEFYEVDEKNIQFKNNKNINTISNNNNKNEEIKRNVSPVKDPENIKLSMKKLNFKAPKWAENMTDDDFIKIAKNKIKK